MRHLALLLCCAFASFALSLDEALQLAQTHSPLLKNARIAVQQAKTQQKIARSKNFGTLLFGASYTHYNVPRTLEPIVPPLTSPITVSNEIKNFSLTYRVTLFNGFADVSDLKLAHLGRQIATLRNKLTKEQLYYNIKSLYFSGLELQTRLRAMRSYIKALKELERKTSLEVELGKKAKLDLYQVQNELEGARAKERDLLAQLTTLKAALAATIGIERIEQLESAKEELSAQKEELALKIASLQVKKSKKAITKAKAHYYPKIEALGSYAKNYAQDQEAELWQAGVSLSYTLLDFGRSAAMTQQARLDNLKAKNDLLKTKLEHEANRIKALEQIEKVKALIKHYQAQQRLREKIYHAQKIRYETGAIDMSDYLEAIAALHQAQADLKAAYYDLYKAYAYYNFIQRSGS